MDRRLIGALIQTLPYAADIAQSAFNGFQPNPPDKLSIGDYINSGMNPEAFQRRQKEVASHQLGDLGAQIYQLETQGKTAEAREKRKELLQIGGQFGDDPGIARQFSEINNMLNTSDDNAMKILDKMMELQGKGIRGQVVPQSQNESPGFTPPYPNAIKVGGGAWDRNTLYLDPSNPLANGPQREQFHADRGDPNPYGSKTPEELAQAFPQVEPSVREQYQALNSALKEQQYNAQNHPDADKRSEYAVKAATILDHMRKLKGNDSSASLPSLPQNIASDPVLAYWKVPETRVLPSVTINNKGLRSTTQAEQPTTGEERARSLLSRVKTMPAPPEWQDRAAHYINSNQLTESQLKTVNATLENIDVLSQIRTTLTNQAGDNLKVWHNPISNKNELMPDFKVGQGFDGLVEHIKLNYNPFGIWQAMGVGPTDGTLEIVEKSRKLYTQNNQRMLSGLQTTDQEYLRMQQMFLEGVMSGDANKFWTALRQAEDYSQKALEQQKRALDESSLIPSSIRKEFMKHGIKDPYPTLWEDQETKGENLPPPTLPKADELSDEKMGQVEKLWKKVEPFKSMPERTEEEKVAKMKAIQSFMLESQ